MPGQHPSLRLDERFTHLVLAGGSAVLVADDNARLLESPVAVDVVRRIDGRANAIEIAEALAERYPRELVYFTLLSLQRAAIARSATAEPRRGERHSSARDAVESTALRLEHVWKNRGGAGAVGVPLERPGAVLLVLTDDYLHPDVPKRVQEAVGAESSVLLAGLGTHRVWLGPAFGAGAASCLSCLQERLRLNLSGRALVHVVGRAPEEGIEIHTLDRTIPWGAFVRLASGVLDVLEGGKGLPSLTDVLRVLPWAEGDEEHSHAVARDSGCAECGNRTLAPPGAHVRLSPRHKVGTYGGGYRTREPQDTLARYLPLVSPLTGIVRSVQRVPVDDSGLIHVYTASHARDMRGGSVKTIRADRRDAAGGKGRTDLDARVSALCEALERFSAIHRGSEPCKKARQSELGAEAIDPDELLLFSPAQYHARNAWNVEHGSGMQWVPEAYADEPIEWSPVLSLTTGDRRFVPSAAVYLSFRGEGARFCKGDSNGLSSGNTIEEAILQGLLELVERDAVALWWYNRVRVPALDLESFDDRYLLDVRGCYERLGRRVWALDLTTDLGVPCFAALAARRDQAREEIIFGFGAHLDARIALSRAVTELNQMLPSVLRTDEERRAQLLPDFADVIRWWNHATLKEHRHLMPAEGLPLRRLNDFSTPARDDLREDVLDCVARVYSSGVDVLVHNLTRADVGLAVARVFAPGLRHFWRRLAPGRLYEVPVRLGWLAEPLREQELNPVSLFV